MSEKTKMKKISPSCEVRYGFADGHIEIAANRMRGFR